jgi:hypothetical protein
MRLASQRCSGKKPGLIANMEQVAWGQSKRKKYCTAIAIRNRHKTTRKRS